MRRPRLVVVLFAHTALAVTLAAWLSGAPDVLLTATPFLLVFGLPLFGRFVGEERILAFHRARREPRRRGAAPNRPRGRELALTSLLERTPRSLRGPPAPATV